MNRILIAAGALWAASLGGGFCAAAGESSEERDLDVLRAEIGLEMCLETVGPEADSTLPLPAPGGAPAVDGDLGEPFWESASLFLWETAGDSVFRETAAWRISLAWAGDSLFFGGERPGAPEALEVLSIDGSPRERLCIRVESPGRASARVEWAGATGPVEGHGGEFAARTSTTGVSFELKIPPGFLERSGPRGPFRLTSSRGRLAAVRVSPRFRLEPDQLALRMLAPSIGLPREVTAGVELRSLEDRPLQVEMGPYRSVELGARARRVIRQTFPAFPGPGAVRSTLAVAGRPLPYQAGVPTLFVHPERLNREAGEVLERAAENLRRIEQPTPALSRELERVAAALAAGRGDAGLLEGLYLEARLARRRTVLAGLPQGLEEVLFTKRFHYRYGPYYTTYLHDMPGGNLAVVSLKSGEQRDLLAMPPGGSVRDPCLRFDGRRIVFSMRRRGSGANLYSVGIDGSELSRITEGEQHDLEPCWLPGGDILFASNRPRAQNPLNHTDSFSLHRVREDGTGLLRVSFNYLVDFTPAVMPDGRVVFTRWVHEDKPGNFLNALWTMHPDGSRLAGLFGMNRPGVTIEAQSVPGTDRLVCLSSGPMGQWRDPQVGDIAVLDVNLDRNAFLYEIRAERGGFKNPFPVGPDLFLAAYGAPDTRWGIYLVDRWGNREPIHRDHELSCFNPIPLSPRPEPSRLAPAGPLGAPEGRKTGEQALVSITDVYRGLPGVERGSLKRLRLVAVVEKPPGAMQGFLDQTVPVGVLNRMVRRSLGTAPIHPDGSAYFRAPPDVSLFFQVLDGEGLMIETMRDTVSFAPGETRSCIGCHEPRTAAPPAVDRGRRLALEGPPSALEREPGPAAISFPRDIQPILDRRCLSCHDAADPAGRVILSGDLTPFFSLAYETLTRGGSNANNQNWGREARAGGGALAPAIAYVTDPLPPYSTGARASPLFGLLEAKHGGAKLTPEERALLARWMDLNLPYYDDWETPRLARERRLLSPAAEAGIRAVMRTWCRGCHPPPDLIRGGVLSLTRPALSPLLRAPLSPAAGGWGRCGGGIFEDRAAPAYRVLLDLLEGERQRLLERGAR